MPEPRPLFPNHRSVRMVHPPVNLRPLVGQKGTSSLPRLLNTPFNGQRIIRRP